jgi:hypothetical protein
MEGSKHDPERREGMMDADERFSKGSSHQDEVGCHDGRDCHHEKTVEGTESDDASYGIRIH